MDSVGVSDVVIIPVPWAVTVAPHANPAIGIEEMSVSRYAPFIDGHQQDVGMMMENEVPLKASMLPLSPTWQGISDRLRRHMLRHFAYAQVDLVKKSLTRALSQKIDDYALNLNEEIKQKARMALLDNKLVAVLGGDHSVALGLIESLARFYNNFGILHIDAHPDLHTHYLGVHYSHASIMYNVLQLPYVTRLVQVGLRHCTYQELSMISAGEGRIFPFFATDLYRQYTQGVAWETLCQRIIALLPDTIYISFDIDGLDASFCPNTGTPVSGGLKLDELLYLLEQIVVTGKRIIGFDLCEVAPGKGTDWDATIGSIVLYSLASAMQRSTPQRP